MNTFTFKKNIYKTACATAFALGCMVGSSAYADIVIGSSLSSTGFASPLGEPEAQTLKMLVDDINAKGGVLGEKIRLISYDDTSDPYKASVYTERLINSDKVVAIIGGSTSGASMAIMPIAEEAGIPFISLASAIEIIQPIRPHTFKTPHTDRMACAKLFEDMKARNITKIGLLSGTDGFGVSMRKHCLDVIDDYGITVLADELFGFTDTDMTPHLTDLNAKNGIQALMVMSLGAGPAIITRNYAQLGMNIPLYHSHGVASDSFINAAGAAAEGIRLPGTPLLIADLLDQYDPQHEVIQNYKQSYEKKTGKPVSTFGGYAHDAFYLIIDAIERAGKTDPASIRDALESTKDFIGTTGIYNISPKDHLGLDVSSFRMLEIHDGKWVNVDRVDQIESVESAENIDRPYYLDYAQP